MKKIKMIALCLGLSTATFAQTNVMPNSGPVYFGIQNGNFVSGFNFQLHGVEPLCPPAQGGPKVIWYVVYLIKYFFFNDKSRKRRYKNRYKRIKLKF